MTTVACKGCGAVLNEPAGLPVERRTPCPGCGSLARAFGVVLEAGLRPHGHLAGKARHGQPGEMKPHVEFSTGASFSRNVQRWNRRSMRVDHENDRYDEVVTDAATGAILHGCHEPLSRHQGHGDAKRKATRE